MAILESVKELASKLGAETNGRTIADQINIINQHLEAETANDIAGAVKEYSKKAGSGGGGETFEVEIETLFPGDGFINTVNKTYQQIKSEIDLGKKLTGISTGFINSSKTEGQSVEMWSANLETAYISDLYDNSGAKAASDAIIILTKPFLYYGDPISSPQFAITAFSAFAITPDDKVLWNIGPYWGENVSE